MFDACRSAETPGIYGEEPDLINDIEKQAHASDLKNSVRFTEDVLHEQ
jgi:hypothetical protein